MKKLILFLTLTFLLATFANAQDLGKIDEAVQKQIGTSLTSYYALSNALIDSDAEKASTKADELSKTFDAVDVTKMTAAQKTAWGKLEKLLRQDATHINKNKELAHQREHFAKLSNNMYALVFNFKANETEAYLQYCPMKKASWLSDKKDIRNPYYGNKMLDCGSIKATLKKNNLVSATSPNSLDAKLVGQIVCSSCWFEEEDRNKNPYGNQADIECAERCSKNNLGQSLAVKNEKGEFTLYALEKGAFDLKAKDFLEFVPKNVEIEGVVREANGKKFIKVDSLKTVKVVETQPLPVDAKLALNDLSGVAQDIKNFNGRFTVVNFWATWCVPCKEEMPDLAAIQNDYAALGVQVIGATADAEKDKEKVLKFIRTAKVNFPIWLGLTNDQMLGFGVGKALPATAIVNREGKIVWRKIGKIDAKELRKELDKLLNEKVAKTQKSKADNTSLVPA